MKHLLKAFPVRQRIVSHVVEQEPGKWRTISGLWVQGSDSAQGLFERLPRQGLTIVGTRRPQNRSLAHVAQVVRQLSGQPLCIISGFALGVDTAAHQAALAAKLPTIAFIGAGHDLNYPPENYDLKRQILESGGLIISEYPMGSPGRAHHFLERNALMVLYSHAVWIVEAAFKSGAMNTAAHAVRQSRTLFVTPAFPTDTAYAGNLKLLDPEGVGTLMIDGRSLGAAWSNLCANPEVIDGVKMHRSDLSPNCALLVKLIGELEQTRQVVALDSAIEGWRLGGGKQGEFFGCLNEALTKRALRRIPGGLTKT